MTCQGPGLIRRAVEFTKRDDIIHYQLNIHFLHENIYVPGCMMPLDIGLPSYVLYGPSTLANSIDASREAKYIVSKISTDNY